MKAFILLLVSFVLIACSSNPTGTVSVRSVEPDGTLKEPLISTANLIKDGNTIFKTEADGSTDGNDVYAIYLTDAYLKYLADWWGVNEVIFVVEFTEAVTGETDSDITTKILGPYEKLADGIKAPFLNKALYGPKKMESDLLSMNIKVYEYDLDENDGSSAMLEFIAATAESFSLSNPITLGEIKLAKEIANTLLLANENDLVMEMDIDFVAGNSKYTSSHHSNVVPLKDGEVIMVKQEGCAVMTCYDYFSKDWSNLPGLLPDLFMLIPTTLNRAFVDTPDHSSLKDFNDEKLIVTKDGITEVDDQKKPKGLYKDKTWLRLNIVKGGDASQWSFRKKLYPTAEEVEKLLKNPYSLNQDNIDSILKGINDAQKSLTDVTKQAVVQLTSEMSQNNIHFIEASEETKTSGLCLHHPENVTIINLASRPTDNNQTFLYKKVSSSKQGSCYTVTASPEGTAFTQGKGDFIVNYDVNDTVNVQNLPYLVRSKLADGDVTLSCHPNTDNTSYQLVLNPKEGREDKLPQITDITFSDANQDIPFTTTDQDIKTNSDFDQKNSVSLKVKDIFGAVITPSIPLADIQTCLKLPQS
ncbi:hypothetical protein [Marinomonas sp. TW1]|uniref:hypothetical protein n=1 Tax=Marinomonas sp. TW1 TaxID=1561203 RepID=UPI0007AF43EE|nr:hypothetical protein [Marinomonas sp. TW1]KZN15447.1 hypothetical protein OA79_01420 [Marinomonas sp. TW1]